MSNPLLEPVELPAFDRIQPEHALPAIETALTSVRALVDELLGAECAPGWETLAAPVEEVLEGLQRVWAPVSHMNAMVNSAPLREAHNACLPLLSAFETDLGQHEGLYRAFRAIADSPDFANLDHAQQKVIENRLRDFRLTGIELGAADRERFKR
ncbi:MAG: oligopeptidase A, partial [Gammaproteobacteria bacterium]